MNNKIQITNPKYQRAKFIAIILLLPMILAIMVLFTFRALETRNYNGRTTEVSGIVVSIDANDDDVEITLDNDAVYSANRIRTCYPDFDLDSLLGTQVTLVLPEMQVGEGSISPWILGIKQGDETLIDYLEVIADGKAEAKLATIICSVIASGFAATSLGILLLTRQNRDKEEDFYKVYCDFAALRQPSCPEYKRLPIATIIYLAVVILIVAVSITIIGATTENLAAQISVGVSACVVFAGCTAGLLVYSFRLVKKEREFYAKNFPFDLDDISHVTFFGKQKQQKEQLQAELREERKNFPHRYFDAGNDYTVDFTESGVEFFDEMEVSEIDADSVFGENEANSPRVNKLAYQRLNFEALPYYRKKDHPLTIIIKSRIEDTHDLPQEMIRDFHLLLDSNLLATLQHFGVAVENLQSLLDDKAQLIRDNCEKRKERKNTDGDLTE